jgi:hypothetical protein
VKTLSCRIEGEGASDERNAWVFIYESLCALVEHHPRASELVVDGCLGVMRGRSLFTLDPKRGGCGVGGERGHGGFRRAECLGFHQRKLVRCGLNTNSRQMN